MLPDSVLHALMDIRGKSEELTSQDAGIIFAFSDEEPFSTYIQWCKKTLLHCYNVRTYYFSSAYKASLQQSRKGHKDEIRNSGGWAGPHLFLLAMMLNAFPEKERVFIEAGVFKGGTVSCLRVLIN